MSMFARFAALVTAAFLAGCYPTIVHPIGSTAPMTADARLLGGWKAQPKHKDNGPMYLFFFEREGGKLEALLAGTPTEGDKGGWMTYEVMGGKLGAHDFLNGRALLDDGHPSKDASKEYTPTFYSFDGKDTLHIYTLGTDAIEAAVTKGQIKGEVKKNSFGDDVRITADAKAVDAFFASRDPKVLFTDELGVYHRLR